MHGFLSRFLALQVEASLLKGSILLINVPIHFALYIHHINNMA